MVGRRLSHRALGAAVGTTAAILVTANALGAGSRDTHASSSARLDLGIVFTCPNAICTVNPYGSGRSVFITAWYDGFGEPAWAPDGSALAFRVSYSDTSRIAVFRLRTRRREELGLGDSRSYQPSWSPDGRRIAVTELWRAWDLVDRARSTIEILSLATGTKVAVTHRRRDRVDTEPAWSPDGRSIAFARREKGRPQTVWLVQPDGGRARPLTRGRAPSWSPAGDRLVFALGRSIYEIRVDGSGRRRIIDGLRHPVAHWSPDGTRLLVVSGRNAWVTDTEGKQRHRVLHERHDIEGLAWRPG
jgi:TolB protein